MSNGETRAAADGDARGHYLSESPFNRQETERSGGEPRGREKQLTGAERAGNNGGESGALPAGGPIHGRLGSVRCPSLVANSAGPATSTSAEQPAASPPLLPSITD